MLGMVGAAREVVIATLAAGWKREVPKGMGWGHVFNVRGVGKSLKCLFFR